MSAAQVVEEAKRLADQIASSEWHQACEYALHDSLQLGFEFGDTDPRTIAACVFYFVAVSNHVGAAEGMPYTPTSIADAADIDVGSMLMLYVSFIKVMDSNFHKPRYGLGNFRLPEGPESSRSELSGIDAYLAEATASGYLRLHRNGLLPALSHFTEANNHNPRLARRCPICGGSGLAQSEAMGESDQNNESCSFCDGLMFLDEPGDEFSNGEPAISVKPNSLRFVTCTCCGKRFCVDDKNVSTGRRHICGQEFAIVEPSDTPKDRASRFDNGDTTAGPQ